MRDSLFGFYTPTADDYDKLWKEGTFIFDANSLLDLYRATPGARNDLLGALGSFKDRLWLPYQAALEFQRNRCGVIAESKNSMSLAREEASRLIETLKTTVKNLKLEQYPEPFDVQPIVESLDDVVTKISSAIKANEDQPVTSLRKDPIRERLDEIFKGRIGEGPSSQDQLDSLTEAAEARFQRKQPPGFMDEKLKNKSEFIHNGLTYTNAYGDLIMWRQILAYAKQKEIKYIIFVTSEKKEDWWWKEQGKIIAPHQELVHEIRNESGVDIFWMYNPANFLKESQKYTHNKIDGESVQNLNEITAETTSDEPSLIANIIERRENGRNEYNRVMREESSIGPAVQRWLETMYDSVLWSDPYPSFFVSDQKSVIGVQIHLASVPSVNALQPLLKRSLRFVSETSLSGFHLVIIITSLNDKSTEIFAKAAAKLRNEIAPSIDITIGKVLGQTFFPLIAYPKQPTLFQDGL